MRIVVAHSAQMPPQKKQQAQVYAELKLAVQQFGRIPEHSTGSQKGEKKTSVSLYIFAPSLQHKTVFKQHAPYTICESAGTTTQDGFMPQSRGKLKCSNY